MSTALLLYSLIAQVQLTHHTCSWSSKTYMQLMWWLNACNSCFRVLQLRRKLTGVTGAETELERWDLCSNAERFSCWSWSQSLISHHPYTSECPNVHDEGLTKSTSPSNEGCQSHPMLHGAHWMQMQAFTRTHFNLGTDKDSQGRNISVQFTPLLRDYSTMLPFSLTL